MVFIPVFFILVTGWGCLLSLERAQCFCIGYSMLLVIHESFNFMQIDGTIDPILIHIGKSLNERKWKEYLPGRRKILTSARANDAVFTDPARRYLFLRRCGPSFFAMSFSTLPKLNINVRKHANVLPSWTYTYTQGSTCCHLLTIGVYKFALCSTKNTWGQLWFGYCGWESQN